MLKVSSFIIAVAISLPMMAISLVNANPVYWGTKASENMFSQSQHKSDFWALSNFYEAQNNKTFCGVASSTIVLNALRIHSDKAKQVPLDTTVINVADTAYFPKENNWTPYFHRYTQNTVLRNSPKPRIEVFGKPHNQGDKPDYGMQIKQLSDMLATHNVNVKTVVITDKTDFADAKEDIVKALDNKDEYVIANYYRKAVQQKGGGHFSPIAAYDKVSDSFLVMDTNSVKYPWAWIPSKELLNAMNTSDTNGNRGYLIVSEKS